MSNKKKMFTYAVYIIVWFIILYWSLKLDKYLIVYRTRTYKILPSMIYGAVFPILLGLYLGLPVFFKQRQLPGSWKIDWLKFALIGLPSLFMSFLNLIGIIVPGHFIFSIYKIIPQQESFFMLNGIVSGYIILNSLRKEEHY